MATSKPVGPIVKVKEQVIELPTIRLSNDEARMIMRIFINGKAERHWRANSLEDLGVTTEVKKEKRDQTSDRLAVWARMKQGTITHNEKVVRKELDELEKLDRERDDKDKYYTLTPLGREIARGLTVKLNSQFARRR